MTETKTPTADTSTATSTSTGSTPRPRARWSPSPAAPPIADTVVSKIAGIAARDVSGVHALGGGTARAVGAIRERIPGSRTNLSQGVTVEVGERQAAVDLDIVAEYGVAIADLATGIRRNVIDSVERMTGLEVTEVNITVHDVFIDDGTAARSRPARRRVSSDTGATGGPEEPADRVAAAVTAVPGVHGLHGGLLGEVATYLPGRRRRRRPAPGRRVRRAPGPGVGRTGGRHDRGRARGPRGPGDRSGHHHRRGRRRTVSTQPEPGGDPARRARARPPGGCTRTSAATPTSSPA